MTATIIMLLLTRPGWYLEETAWRRKAAHLRVEAESLSEDARCDAAFSAGEAQRLEGPIGDGERTEEIAEDET